MKCQLKRSGIAAGFLVLMILLLFTSAWAASEEEQGDLQVAPGTNSMLFQIYMQPDGTGYPGGFAFALERRKTEKIGIRGGSSFQVYSITAKDREESLSGGEGNRNDRDYAVYSINMAGLLVYHFKSTGQLQASLATGPIFQLSNSNSDYLYDYSNTPGETVKQDASQSYFGLGGQVVLDIQWRLNGQISLLGSYGYRGIWTSTNRKSKYSTTGPVQSVDGYKADGHRWSFGTAGATLGLVYHF